MNTVRNILGSKLRQGILNLFFQDPEKAHYTREICKLLQNKSPGNVHAELKKLNKEGLLETSKIGHICLYKLNKNYLLYAEYSSIVAKTIGGINELKKGVMQIKGITFAFIFGSYAKGNFTSNSDIDLFLIGKPDETQLIKIIKKTEEKLNRTIDFHYADQVEFLKKFSDNFFYRDIIENSILLTENEDEFRKFIGEASKRGQIKKTNYRLYTS